MRRPPSPRNGDTEWLCQVDDGASRAARRSSAGALRFSYSVPLPKQSFTGLALATFSWVGQAARAVATTQIVFDLVFVTALISVFRSLVTRVVAARRAAGGD